MPLSRIKNEKRIIFTDIEKMVMLNIFGYFYFRKEKDEKYFARF